MIRITKLSFKHDWRISFHWPCMNSRSIMKILLLLLLVGYVAANSPDAVLQSATDNILEHFILGMEEGSPLYRVLGVEQNDDVQRLENDIREELARHLRDVFEKAFKKVQEAIKKGQKINEAALEKLRELRNKMKELKIDDDDVTKENLEQLKKQVGETLRKILEKMGILDKRSLDDPMDAVFGELNLRALFIKLKNM
ncbi:uncharacterized protein LOC118203938, partial [Stegodyphus dumicola]|uniref:uncharacterized protein LOC118203938 n=1 Tax=Stegodyphus dumicola TaxID=202533 RepID=UPI0015AE03FD